MKKEKNILNIVEAIRIKLEDAYKAPSYRNGRNIHNKSKASVYIPLGGDYYNIEGEVVFLVFDTVITFSTRANMVELYPVRCYDPEKDKEYGEIEFHQNHIKALCIVLNEAFGLEITKPIEDEAKSMIQNANNERKMRGNFIPLTIQLNKVAMMAN